ncbi:hypothetical protein, partial [Herbaspirillum lusitanum]|uniref:hypothetical protein n=1 Tax=Herbaspirillum lusitanum TaxID=213312 RepID=UPI001EE69210
PPGAREVGTAAPAIDCSMTADMMEWLREIDRAAGMYKAASAGRINDGPLNQNPCFCRTKHFVFLSSEIACPATTESLR